MKYINGKSFLAACLSLSLLWNMQSVFADVRYNYDVNNDGKIDVIDLNCLKVYLFNVEDNSDNIISPSTPSPSSPVFFDSNPETSKKIVRNFLNEEIDESAYCEILTDENMYYSDIRIPINESIGESAGYNTLSRVHIQFSNNTSEEIRKKVYSRISNICNQNAGIDYEHFYLSLYGIDVYLLNNSIVGCNLFNGGRSSRNYKTYEYIKGNNESVVIALNKFFGSDIKSRICFYETVCQYAMFDKSGINYGYGGLTKEGKFNYTELSETLISLTINVPELYGLTYYYDKNGEMIYPYKYDSGDYIKPGKIQFIINIQTQEVEKIANTN